MTYQPPTAPIPVAPLQWPAAPPAPPRRSRPGIITAIGIISIIVACMSGMANLIITFMSFGSLVASRSPGMIRPPMSAGQTMNAQAAPNGATAVVGGIEIDPSQSEDGIDEAQRPMVMSGMTRARALDEGRKKQLDLLLMVAGRSMFPFMSPGTTPQTIRANVSESGRLPSASSGKKGPDYFIIGTGRAEVYDTHAIFRPDGSPAVVSVTAPIDAAANAGVAPPPSNDPNAAPPDPSTQPAPPMPIPPPPTFTPMPNPLASINSTAATLSIVAGILGLLLAIYLLVIGIMTLRDARSGGRLHWWYVGLKIPQVALAITAYSWLIWSFLNGMAATANAAAANSGAVSPPPVPSAAGMGAAAIFWMVLLGSAALAYPLSLVAVLLTKTVREYYRPARN